MGAEEMSQWLGPFFALADNMDWIPSSNIAVHNHI